MNCSNKHGENCGLLIGGTCWAFEMKTYANAMLQKYINNINFFSSWALKLRVSMVETSN
jgi:hypothetical protein